MDALTTKSIKVARKRGVIPAHVPNEQAAEVMLDSMWFSQVRLNIALHNLLRPARNVMRRLIR